MTRAPSAEDRKVAESGKSWTIQNEANAMRTVRTPSMTDPAEAVHVLDRRGEEAAERAGEGRGGEEDGLRC
jgi:hypothetical protein